MAGCRYCGAAAVSPFDRYAICTACENSPLCDRCGHPRGEHTRVFVRRGAAGCRRRVGDFQTLTSWTCDCEGFRPVAGRLADAAFADGSDDASQSLPPLRLRP